MSQKIAQLDAVRGIAVLLVIIHNTAQVPSMHLGLLAEYGWMGVDIFFVLSGFLITGILLDAKQTDGYFQKFYARRCLRIWPLYFGLLVLMFLVLPRVFPADGRMIFERSSPWWAYPLFLQNFLVALPTLAAGPLGVTWSLAIEEQFYLVWPWFVRYLSSVQIKGIAVAVILLSPALRIYLGMHGIQVYSNVFCRLDGLMAGALLAVVERSEKFTPAKYLNVAWASLLIAGPLAILTGKYHAGWMTYSMASLGALALLYLAMFTPSKWMQLVFKNRFLTYTGVISYGLYLLHRIPHGVTRVTHLDRHPLIAFGATVAGSYLLAWLSWTVLEKPFLGLKRFFEMRPAGRSRVVEGVGT